MTDCPHAWPTGLALGMVIECKYEAKHRGWHRNKAGDLAWGGKLTDTERQIADELRKVK